MAFTILNDPAAPVNPAGFGDQAEIDKVDFDIIAKAFDGYIVESGCSVAAQGTPDMTVAVASGVILVQSTIVNFAGANLGITAADATNPRIDLVVINSGGTLSTTDGTANANPCMPAIPASSVVLAAVYVPANDTAINSNQITDKRVIMRRYARLNGTTGGQTLYGDTADNGNLILGGTTSATHTTSIISMLDHVRLASGKVIQDSGGNTRITLSTAAPHVTLTGTVAVTGDTALDLTSTATVFIGLNITPSTTSPTSWSGVKVQPGLTLDANNASINAITGTPTITIGGTTGHIVRGLNFNVGMGLATGATTGSVTTQEACAVSTGAAIQNNVGSTTGSLTVTSSRGLVVNRTYTTSTLFEATATCNLTVTTAAGIYIPAPTLNATGSGTEATAITTLYNIWVPAIATSTAGVTVTTAIGLLIGDITGTSFTAANNRIVQFGTATPTTTSGLFEMMANFTAAANATPIWISEGATPTRRQLKTKAGNTLVAGDLVCVLV